MTIYKKLLEIQKKVTELGKNAESFGYNYVTGGKLLEHIKPLMNENGLLLKQEVVVHSKEQVVYKTKKGEEKLEYLHDVTYRFTWIDTDTGDKDENMFYACGMNDFEKGAGSAHTYAERYFLLKYFHIKTDEDDPDLKDNYKSGSKGGGQNQNQNYNKEESELDKKFLDVWVKLSDEQKLKIGTAYPNKFGKPQNNPQYFKKAEKEAILSKLNK
ncbi:MAG: ERF family protein [Cetobacterium sp.]